MSGPAAVPAGERSPLLLIHGFTDTCRTWDRLAPLLERHHELIIPTLLGHRGRGPLPSPLGRPLDALIADLGRIIDEAGHETVHVVGNSLGGWLALELASRGRARSVVALSPGQGWEGDSVPRALARRFSLQHRLAPFGARHARTLASRPRLRRLVFRDVAAHGERIPPATAVELIRGAAECLMFEPWSEAAATGDFRGELEPITVPLRIAWGTRDRILPVGKTSAWFRAHLPEAEWVELHGCGHLPQLDDPDLVARVVLELTAAPVGETSTLR